MNRPRLALVVIIVLWAAGLVELFGQKSRDPILFDRYSPPFFAFLIAYTLLLIPLLYLLANPGWLSRRVAQIVPPLQQRGWPAVLILLASLLVFTPRLMDWERFYKFPIIHLIFLTAVLTVDGFLLFYGWDKARPKPLWRQVTLAGLGLLLVVELVLQGVSLLGALPGGFRSNAGIYLPYGRIYNPEQGNGMTNRYGWFAPAVDKNSDTRKILLIGDEYIASLETDRAEHLSARLAADLGAAGTDAEVIAIAATGYGPAHYYEAVKSGINLFEPDEIVLFINLGDDFFNVMPNLDPRQPYDELFYVYSEDGTWNLHPQSILPQHLLFHYINDSHRPIIDSILRTVRSHLLTPKLIASFMGEEESAEARTPQNDALPPLGRRQFIFRTEPSQNAETAVNLTRQLLEIAHRTALVKGVTLRIVTIPAFPEAFYAQSGSDWQMAFGDYDLLQPERVLQAFAADKNIPILPMGAQMHDQSLTVDAVRGLFRDNGYGNFTPAGQQFFADAVYNAFYR